jgi:hypothetical protein
MKPCLPVTVKGVAADLLIKRPKLADRIKKAVSLIEEGHIRYQDQGVYLALSSDGKTFYSVEIHRCTCKAGQTDKVCYHRIAFYILDTRSFNQTEVDFEDAIAREEQPTPPSIPQQQDPSGRAEHPVFVLPAKRVQSVGRMDKALTIRHSMTRLGERLTEVFNTRPATAKLH